ncbi:MAG: cation-transporting P-type ATPase [Ruminococcaceae bacterium]|nr:cation-transporting P-type ATPase [Oscillospiraceae bacterium]
MDNKWHIAAVEEIEQALDTDVKNGLAMRQARARLQGELREKNTRRKYLFAKGKPSFIKCIIGVACDPCMILLLAISLFSVVFSWSLQGILMLIIAIICLAVCATMSYVSKKRFASASDYSSPMVRVVRGGEKFYTDGRNVVAGDVLELSQGDVLPCDARIVSAHDLTVKEIIHTADGIKNRTVCKSHNVKYTAQKATCAPDAKNMLYAGTVILMGDARAIVTATMDDVYLAKYVQDGALARLDGPTSLEKEIKPWVRMIRAFSVCAVVIMSLLSVLTFRDALFVNRFMMLLSAIVFASAETVSIGLRYVMSAHMHKLLFATTDASKKSLDLGAAVKSPVVLDKLKDTTRLVILGKSGLRRGDYNVDLTYTNSAILDSLTAETAEANRILTFIYTYVKTLHHCRDENDAVSGDIAAALEEHVKNSGFDYAAADIFLRSLYYVNDGTRGYACAETAEGEFRVALTLDDDILDYCELIRNKNEQDALSPDDVQRVKSFCAEADSKGSKCLFVVSENSGVATLEGVITLVQPADQGFGAAVSDLEAHGVATTVFLDKESDLCLLDELGIAQRYKVRIALSSELSDNEAVDECAEFDVFLGFSADTCVRIVEMLKSRGDKVATLAIDDRYSRVVSCADVAVSCDMLKYDSDKYKNSVYSDMLSHGTDSSVRCSSQMRLFSDVLIKRAHKNGGGISSLFNAIKSARMAYQSVCMAIELGVLVICSVLPFVVFSIVLGESFVEGFQVILLCAVSFILSFALFVEDDVSKKNILSERRNVKGLLGSRLPGIVTRLSVSTFSAIVVFVLGLLGVFGETPSYSTAVFVALSLTLFVEVMLMHVDRTQKGEARIKRWIKVISVFAAVLLVCAVSTQNYFSASLYPHGIGKYEFIIVPVYLILFISGVLISRAVEKNRTGNK